VCRGAFVVLGGVLPPSGLAWRLLRSGLVMGWVAELAGWLSRLALGCRGGWIGGLGGCLGVLGCVGASGGLVAACEERAGSGLLMGSGMVEKKKLE
jgi:hypothetical protein